MQKSEDLPATHLDENIKFLSFPLRLTWSFL
jgi:hypothetical protein